VYTHVGCPKPVEHNVSPTFVMLLQFCMEDSLERCTYLQGTVIIAKIRQFKLVLHK
jgi:hypothetical protein